MTTTTMTTRIGCALFVLWGILHVWVGLTGFAGFLSGGSTGIFRALGGTDVGGGESIDFAAHIALEFSLLLAVLGVQAIWLSLVIWQGQLLGFWLNTAILGMVDAAFVYALVIPGFVSLGAGLPGPILYALGVLFTAWGLASAKKLQ